MLYFVTLMIALIFSTVLSALILEKVEDLQDEVTQLRKRVSGL